MIDRILCWLCRLTLLLLFGSTPALADITVTTDADSGPGSLRAAIASASPREIIEIRFEGTIALTTGPLVVDGWVQIEGPYGGELTISGSDRSRVLEVRPGARAKIDGVVIADGQAPEEDPSEDANRSGGGILNEGTLELVRVTLRDNFATLRGGWNPQPRNSAHGRRLGVRQRLPRWWWRRHLEHGTDRDPRR